MRRGAKPVSANVGFSFPSEKLLGLFHLDRWHITGAPDAVRDAECTALVSTA
jgi:hypothetical protein